MSETGLRPPNWRDPSDPDKRVATNSTRNRSLRTLPFISLSKVYFYPKVMRRGAGVASVDLTSIIQRPCSRREAKIVLTPPPSLCLTAPPVGKKEEGSPFPQARGKLYGPASSTSSPTSSHLLTSFSSFTSDPLALLLGLQ